MRRRIEGRCVRCGDEYPGPALDGLPKAICARCSDDLDAVMVGVRKTTTTHQKAAGTAQRRGRWMKGS